MFHLQHLDQSASGFIDFSKLLCWPYLNPQYHHSSISATCSIFKLASSSEYLVSQLDSTIHNKHSNFQIVKNFYKIPIKIQTNLWALVQFHICYNSGFNIYFFLSKFNCLFKSGLENASGVYFGQSLFELNLNQMLIILYLEKEEKKVYVWKKCSVQGDLNF